MKKLLKVSAMVAMATCFFASLYAATDVLKNGDKPLFFVYFVIGAFMFFVTGLHIYTNQEKETKKIALQ